MASLERECPCCKGQFVSWRIIALTEKGKVYLRHSNDGYGVTFDCKEAFVPASRDVAQLSRQIGIWLMVEEILPIEKEVA
jgi:hypothetical protein